ncbi:hypothetical protein GQX74_003190 [Glossina fuscipes]|nr:hypothetical protein GQX74_003190 [Glossina fuscipes]
MTANDFIFTGEASVSSSRSTYIKRGKKLQNFRLLGLSAIVNKLYFLAAFRLISLLFFIADFGEDAVIVLSSCQLSSSSKSELISIATLVIRNQHDSAVVNKIDKPLTLRVKTELGTYKIKRKP